MLHFPLQKNDSLDLNHSMKYLENDKQEYHITKYTVIKAIRLSYLVEKKEKLKFFGDEKNFFMGAES